MQDHELMLDAVARWVGAHALPVFVAALLVLLLVCAVLWHVLHRWVVPPQDGTQPPLLFLLTRMALGFVVVWLAAWGFSELAEALGAGPAMARADQALADEIGRSVPRQALDVFALLTHVGDAVTIAVLCAVVAVLLWWRRHRGLALGWVVAVAGNALLNVSLKHLFMRTRPLHDAAYSAPGYSFPSGHSSGSVVAWGMLAYVLARTLPERWHLPCALAAAALAFSVGCSRVFLRVHFGSDVLAGFASGTAWLAACVTSMELLRHYRPRRPAA
jgi:undecaprenyl-diphosphatase